MQNAHDRNLALAIVDTVKYDVRMDDERAQVRTEFHTLTTGSRKARKKIGDPKKIRDEAIVAERKIVCVKPSRVGEIVMGFRRE